MKIENVKVTRRKTPPGANIEFLGLDGETIEVGLRGEEYLDLDDAEIISRARETMSGGGRPVDDGPREEAGVDQTLDTP